jgi:SAM-dependent methyltransferase
VPAEQSPKNEPSRRGNADYEWSAFDAEAYFNQYYGEPHPDDDRVVFCAVEAIKQAEPADRQLEVVDVGTGPSLIPLFCALPRAQSLTAWEYTESNVAWLKAELRRNRLRPQWRHFWNTARKAYGSEYHLPDDPMPGLSAKTVVRQGSIFDLPERAFDAATMFFCAESITGRQDEFEAACAAFARCVKPGGALVAALLVSSGGYVVGDRPFPALNLSIETIEEVFSRHVVNVKAEQIGTREREIRSGYSGSVFLTGIAR